MLDDNGIRPPLIAAGINLFGGPLGLIHRHVTGAIPIRRNTKDPAYLITLKAYVAEMLQEARPVLLSRRRAQLQRRAEAGEDRAASTPRCTRRAARPRDHPDGHRLRPRARGSHPRAAARQEAAAAVHARAGRDGALRRRLPVARVRHVRRADSASTACDPQSRTRRARADARYVRARIGALVQGAADGGVRRRDAAVDHAARSRSAHRSR